MTEKHYGIHIINFDMKYPHPNPEGFYLTIEASTISKQRNVYSDSMTHATQQYSIENFFKNFNLTL